MEREVGGGIGMGNTCKPMAVSFQCMTKFTTNKKKKKNYWLKDQILTLNISTNQAYSGSYFQNTMTRRHCMTNHDRSKVKNGSAVISKSY